MAVVCGDCQTGNRDGARFCKGCGRKLAPASTAKPSAADWPETQRMPLPVPVAPPGIFDPELPATRAAAARDDPTVIVPPLRRPSPPSARPPSPPPPPSVHARRATARGRPLAIADMDAERALPRKSRAPWRFLGVIAALVVVAGGLYLYSDSDADLSPAAELPTAAVPVSTPLVPPASVVPTLEAPRLAPPPPVPAPVAEQAESRPAPPSVPSQAAAAKPHVDVAQKSRKPASAAPVVAPPVAVVAPPPPLPAAPPPPVEPPNPQTACAGLNFFARARCMVSQCAKADFKASPQCEAVHRQQQIDEEKRNPTMAG